MGKNNRGVLIGDIERWLTLSLFIMQHYDSIELLMVAKMINRYRDSQARKSECFYRRGYETDSYLDIYCICGRNAYELNGNICKQTGKRL